MDLQGEKTVTLFRIIPRRRWESASLEYMCDGEWKQAASVSGLDEDNDDEWTGTIPPVTAGKWRLEIHGMSMGAGVYEFQLF